MTMFLARDVGPSVKYIQPIPVLQELPFLGEAARRHNEKLTEAAR